MVRAASFTSVRLFLARGARHFWPCGPASRSLTACHLNPLRGCLFLGLFVRHPPAGTGILTGCPSPTLLSLGLGPTNPTRTDLPSETLDLRRTWFSHVSRYSCQHSHSRAVQRSLPDRLRPTRDAPLPRYSLRSRSPASVPCLSPVTFSAQSRSTSELLRTLSRVAASKPTSWLSRHDHIVSHLAWTSGP